MLPPLALQLLLENALKHNTAFQADPLRLRVAAGRRRRYPHRAQHPAPAPPGPRRSLGPGACKT
ncbi:MAG: hypothetical protein WKG07_43425 [Hymenobacter sp.]